MNYCRIDTVIGRLTLVEKDGALSNIFFENQQIPTGMSEKETAVLEKAAKELDEYFKGKRKDFDIPIAPEGTKFQRKVWDALRDIPFGETRSYGQIARLMGNEKACRAVGAANGKNPLPIVIPCHRIIGKNGRLTGFAGGLDVKEKLLSIENVEC